MDIYSRYLHYARRSQKLLSRFNALRPFCDNRKLLDQILLCAQHITVTFIRNIIELDLDETFASFYGEIIDGNNLSIILELYEHFGRVISGKYEAYLKKRIFNADFVLLDMELMHLKLLIAELEEGLTSEVRLGI